MGSITPGDDQGESLAKTAHLRSVHPTTASRRRHRFPRATAVPHDAKLKLHRHDRKGRDFETVLPQVGGASAGRALADGVTPDKHRIGDGGRPVAAFARRVGIPFHAVLAPGKLAPQASHLHTNTSTFTTAG